MEKNIGGNDRIARLILGPILILAGIARYAGLLALAVGSVPQALASVIVFLVGIFLVTEVVEKCPLNEVLGTNAGPSNPPEKTGPT